MNTIISPREQWILTNLTSRDLPVADLVNFPVIKSNSSFDALQYATADKVGSSLILKNYVRQRWISFGDYLHTHDDKVNVADIPDGLDIVTNGPTSDADQYHTHNNKANVYHLHDQYLPIVDFFSILSQTLNLDDIAYKSQSVNQFFDLNSSGNSIDNTVALSHEELHTIVSHDTLATGLQLNILVGGVLSNADNLHSHKLVGGATDVTATFTEINQALDGINTTVSYINLNILTAGPTSDADHLHTHSFDSIYHNILLGLQGGDPSADEYYHLSLDQINNIDQALNGISINVTAINLNILTGGALSSADNLHTHYHNNLLGLQGGGVGEYYHLTLDQINKLHWHENLDILDLLGEDSAGYLTFNGSPVGLDGLWERSGTTLSPLYSSDNVVVATLNSAYLGFITNDNCYLGDSTTFGSATLGSATNNIAIGSGAAAAMITCTNMVALGYNALASTTNSDRCVAVGAEALTANLGAQENVGIGYQSGTQMTTGGYNTAVGTYSLLGIILGEHNVGLGYEVNHDSDVSGCVLIGYQAGYSNARDNTLMIDNSNTVTPLIYGEFDNKIIKINGGQVAVLSTKTNDYTIVQSDYTILADATSNTVTITLPAAPNQGQIFNIKCIDSTFVCTVARNGKNIDGDASDITLIEDESITIQYDSTFGWAII